MFGVCKNYGVVKVNQEAAKVLERKGDIINRSHVIVKKHSPYLMQKSNFLYWMSQRE